MKGEQKTKNMEKFKKILKIGFMPLALPLLTSAQGTDFFDIMTTVRNILNQVIPILLIIATVIFIWGLIWYILSVGKEESRKEARNIMIWGIIILFVVVAVWGLVNVIGDTFNIQNENIPTGPLPQ